ncbi:MAG: DUF2541 family protein [Saprospiraceae bacterium]|nr:DUF2541 family protein [Saprospiraceae bacterium]
MKAFASILCLLVAVNFATANQDLHTTGYPTPPRWEKLGERKVNFAVDRDEILVTAAEGRFTALKILVKKGGINLRKMVVHFGDGTEQEVETRDEIRAGGESRVINLEGARRVIRKVVFVYDTKNFADQKAEVELWGRH